MPSIADFLRCLCPDTKAEIRTAITVDAPSLARVWGKQIRLQCGYCGNVHLVNVKEAYVQQALSCLPLRPESLISATPVAPRPLQEPAPAILSRPCAKDARKATRNRTARAPGGQAQPGARGANGCEDSEEWKILTRIRKLAIPPAWTDVWICPEANAHIQATGRDARGRKQYRYHSRFRETRDGTKFEHMVAFAKSLPAIRSQVAKHMALGGLPREKVLATVVQLLETTLIRVGNDSYARENNSFGLTTLRNRHVSVNGSALRFQFKGKSGKIWRLQIKDRRISKIVRACQDLPGQELFQYVDENGELKDVTSSDVNAYLREVTSRDVTAKDFRTWQGTVLAALALQEFHSFDTKAASKKNVKAAIERGASRLGNTPTI